MRRLFNIVFGSLAMLAVAIVSAFISMRLAIHGREVEVPNLAGMTVSDAAVKAAGLGLNLNMENRFYSAGVPAGRILTQSPAPGSLVRREGQIRVAESLGSQHVVIPDLIGQSERAASVVLRRVSLELGSVAHVPAPGPEGVILAQTPPPNAKGADSPRVGLLVSDAMPAPEATPEDYVMPTLTGLTVATANARLATAGFRIASAQSPVVHADPAAAPAALVPNQAALNPAPLSSSSAIAFDVPLFQTAPVSYVITSQSPPAGHRLVKGDPIHVTAGPRGPVGQSLP